MTLQTSDIVIPEQTNVIDTSALRKARGAFFTPAALCDYIANWAIRDVNDSILEPSCGEAAFLVAAARRLDRLARMRRRVRFSAGRSAGMPLQGRKIGLL